MLLPLGLLLAIPAFVSCSAKSDPWSEKYSDASADLGYTGIMTFAHLPHVRCIDDASATFDIAILGVPFDGAVSFRPGARFGPNGIRSGSRRQTSARGWNVPLWKNPYQSGLRIIDCGDIPTTPYDSTVAIDQIETAYSTLLQHRQLATPDNEWFASEVTKKVPKIVSLGGDHTIVLPILRALNKVHGPVAVIHFDAHIDTWNPARYPGVSTKQGSVNHGTFFWTAYEEGLIMRNSSIHAGVRTRLTGPIDYTDDVTAGFEVVHTFDVDEEGGVGGIVKRIRDRVGNKPVYLSLDIDVLDPSFAPGTGTPETGGFTTREVRRLLHGLKGLNFVGFDLVEVSPPFDTKAELTNLAAADIIFEFLTILTPDVPAPSPPLFAGKYTGVGLPVGTEEVIEAGVFCDHEHGEVVMG